jgi:hypothetical protein
LFLFGFTAFHNIKNTVKAVEIPSSYVTGHNRACPDWHNCGQRMSGKMCLGPLQDYRDIHRCLNEGEEMWDPPLPHEKGKRERKSNSTTSN